MRKKRVSQYKRIKWTSEVILFTYDMLRVGASNQAIARRLGISKGAVANYLAKTDKSTLLKGMETRRTLWLRRAPVKKPQPVFADVMREEIMAHFKMTPLELSQKNMEEFFADEIALVREGRRDEVASTTITVLRRYDLIPKYGGLLLKPDHEPQITPEVTA